MSSYKIQTIMHFAQPLWILVGIACCLGLTISLRLFEKRRQETLQQFAAGEILGRLTRHVSHRRRWGKYSLLIVAVMLLFTALARPQYGYSWVEVKRKGIDILFALDSSKSMLAEDIKPNRLQRARLGIMDFVSQLEGDRVGLLPFAGSAFLMCPLTLDYTAFTDSLSAVNTGIIPRGGTNISAVIEEAERVLSNDANHKILILLTDGENLEGDALDSAARAQQNDMTIYTVGIGTAEGELIPVSSENQGGFIKNEKGGYVTSRLDEKNLIDIAKKTDGIYVELGGNGEGLQQIYRQKLALIPKEELAERRQKVPIERASWPMGGAILLLLIEFLVRESRTRAPSTLAATKLIKKIPKAGGTALLIAFTCSIAVPFAEAGQAEQAYQQEDYLKAAELYEQALKKDPDNPLLHYNYGTAAYKNNLFVDAVASFSEALKSSDLPLQAKAYYNRGNAYYQRGMESRQADPKVTVEQWQQSLKSYDGALQLNPDDSPARENRIFVQKQLDQLEQQLEQQQQEKKDKQQGEQENEDPQDSEQQQKDDQRNGDSDPQSSENKKNKEQPEQQPKQTASGQDEGEKEQPEQQQPDDTVKSDQEAAESAAEQQEQAARNLQRRQLGKMTREEAENLLNALKNEEKELNFVPVGQAQDSVGRDW